MTAPHALTLDGLFRRAGVRNAQSAALADPPNRAAFTDGAPRRLTYAEADRAISAFAAILRGLGLHAGTVVGLQLPNTVESAVAVLGTQRAGMVAALLPLLWRQRDMVDALGRAGAKAIVTMGRIGSCAHAGLAMEVAASLFPIRQICAFGSNLPDGVVPLDGVFTNAATEPPPHRNGDAAAPVAITFGSGADGHVPVSHDHARLLAAGASLALAGEFTAEMPILSTVPLGSFAGLAVSLMPWLIAGGTLHLHHGFDAAVFAAQAAALDGGAVVVPGPALPACAGFAAAQRIIALWREPLGAAAETPNANAVDVVCRDETAIVAAARGADGLPDPAIVEAANGLAAPGMIRVGAYQFHRAALDAAIAAADPAAVLAAVPDAILGNRLAGHAPDPARVAAVLAARGAHALVAGAFRGRLQPLPSQ